MGIIVTPLPKRWKGAGGGYRLPNLLSSLTETRVYPNLNAVRFGDSVTALMQLSRSSWRKAVVLLAVVAIFVHVSTRTFHGISVTNPSVESYPPHAKHQNLNADAFELVHPVSPVSMLLRVAAPHAPPQELRVHVTRFTESLYNRPPPVSSLL